LKKDHHVLEETWEKELKNYIATIKKLEHDIASHKCPEKGEDNSDKL